MEEVYLYKIPAMLFSIIIPVYNRPDEVDELLSSLLQATYRHFEVVIVEDGSTLDCKEVVQRYADKLQIAYYYKANSGPGDSRNYGMKKAKGDYFIIFDSDCIIPPQYLAEVDRELKKAYVDCFGGPDKALKSFSYIQRAINFAMTSFLTTGGIRGGSETLNKFQPRSFNMGISKKAFEASQGFGNIHPGEDPDLSIRLWQMGFNTRLFSKAYVYHKRRIDWEKFSLQVNKFGKARPILNRWYPAYAKLTFWLPTLFVFGLIASCFGLVFLWDWGLRLYTIYFALIFIFSSVQNRNPIIGFLSIIAVWKQFMGYGSGFIKSYFKIHILKQKPEKAFPELFFKKPIEEQLTEAIHIDKEAEEPIHKSVEKAIDKIISPLQKIVEATPVKTKIIGLTGGIGSGKTTLANYLSAKGYPVYISDQEAKKVMDFPEVIQKIITVFGPEIVDESQKLNRKHLAELVFNNQEKLKQLNAIVHPAVKLHFEEWMNAHKKFPLVFKEAAILFESGSYKDCDAVITVMAPLDARIARVEKRDQSTREQILQRINNQLSDDERAARSDYVIQNENFEDTKRQIEEILILLKNKQ